MEIDLPVLDNHIISAVPPIFLLGSYHHRCTMVSTESNTRQTTLITKLAKFNKISPLRR